MQATRTANFNLVRVGTYSVPFIFSLLEQNIDGLKYARTDGKLIPESKYILLDGHKFKTLSDRYVCFYLKGIKCVQCGLKGEFFAMERSEQNTTYHLNLYGVKNGQEVLFTKDHIKPKSKGGKDHISNYQTMCCICNQIKGNDYKVGM